MGHGGARPGAGRKKGQPNKRTIEREQAMADAAARVTEALSAPFDGDAHAFLMLLYKDCEQPVEVRLDAAKAAIRYEKPALASVEVSADVVVSDISAEPLTETEWEAQHASSTEH
ncbi:MAG: hypothetical protein ABFC96_01265 [Thermoguttaceae bacterium]